MRLHENIFGKEVLNIDAKVIGKVVDIEVDDLNFSIDALILKKPGFHLHNEEFAIPFINVDKIGDKILLKDDY
jgi:sporulation protein YlmC with PRC-barrel domain